MSQIADDPIVIEPQEQCANCHADPVLNGFVTALRNFRCPQCSVKFCTKCFEPNYDDHEGHTFFCPHCKQLLAFPKVC